MAGRHVAFLDGGTAGNHFLHTTRATLRPNTIYTFIAAIGVRDLPAGFGGALVGGGPRGIYRVRATSLISKNSS